MQQESSPQMPSPRNHSLMIAVIFILAGVVMLLDRIGLIHYNLSHILLSWPMLLIIIGLFSLKREKKNMGILLLVIGGIFLIKRILWVLPSAHAIIPLNHICGKFWPLLMIVVGVLILVNNKRKQPYVVYGQKQGNTAFTEAPAEGYFHKESIFSGSEHIFLSPVFRGGNIFILFGGIKLDLTHTQLPFEDQVILNVNCYFGGLELYLPQNCIVESHVQTIFGGMEDKRRYTVTDTISGNKLIITGNVIFGGLSML